MHLGGCSRSLLHEYIGASMVAGAYWTGREELSSEGLGRGGSVATLWHTSVSSEAVMSRISLWRIVGKPPMWQIIAWSTEKFAPQLHLLGMLLSCQLYLRRRASLKSPLCNWKPCVPMGRTDSHDEAPFSLAKIICVMFQITNDWHQLLVSMPIV